MLRTGENGRGLLINPALQALPGGQQRRVRRQEAMIEHLANETALEIEHERQALTGRQQGAEQGAFVQIGMNQVRLPAPGRLPDRGGQQQVERKFAPGGTDRHVAAACARGPRRAHDGQAGHLTATRIGDDAHLVATRLQRLRVALDAHVTAVVSKKAGGCNHQHPVG
ncbi:hypothetical protein [Candidatus Amarolinea dominans]|uniref:hypothetical protein n=1 Tax=Candidatus Amarolinea dominans TaxID=3140696 RepID=UPI001D8D6477|nr:hypothetical protein [Anaerolineae bacterium]